MDADSTRNLDEILSSEQLEAFQSRVAQYDQNNEFFREDFDVMKASGYLIQAVPEELGGLGLSFAEVCQQQRRLAYYAPADALAINMHIYWTGVAADLWRSGDNSLEWLLREACAGEVFAAGHAEKGNDVPMLHSTCKAERVDGGYCFTGRKNFGSLSPVWTRLGLHGIDDSDPDNPKIIHAFLPRDAEGLEVKENWDVMGMRATQSHDTLLDAAFVPDKYIVRVLDEGMKGADMFIVAVFVWALLGFGNVYCGLAQHAFDKALASIPHKTSVAMTRSMAWHPEVQKGVMEMAVELDAIKAHLDRTADDWSNGVDHGPMWGAKALMTKYHAVESAWRVIDRAFELAGGFGIFHASGWERILRDGRIGRIHPGNVAITTEFVAKMYLNLDIDAQPRWG